MSEELAAFLEKVQSDPELQQRLSSLNSVQEVIDVAAEEGFLLNESDFTVPELENRDAAALGNCFCFAYGHGKNSKEYPYGPYKCSCPAVGDGGICSCIIGGSGDELYCKGTWI